jgi:hypothetical protein
MYYILSQHIKYYWIISMHKITLPLIAFFSFLAHASLMETAFGSDETFIEQKSQKIDPSSYVKGLCEFYDREPNAKRFSYAFEANHHELQGMAGRLNLQLSEFETFANPLVIKHRPLTHGKLLLGCGNCPNMIGVETHPWSEEDRNAYRLAHLHEGFDTIDANFARDPNYVMNFGGHPDIKSIFGDRTYGEIYFEGGPEFNSASLIYPEEICCESPPHLKQNLLQILKPDGRIYEGRESEFGLALIRDGDDFKKAF